MRIAAARWILLIVVAAGAGVGLAFLRGSADEPLFVRTEVVMATPVTVQLPAVHAPAAQVVFDIFRGVDERMSEWKATSPLSAVNAAAGSHPVPVPDDLRAVIRRALEIARLTDGAFDPTWAALWGVWDFKAASPSVPAAALVEERRALVDATRVVVDDAGGTVYLEVPGMVLGLGGIAKGHALDMAAQALRERGVTDFMIEAGGQVMAGGVRSHADGGRPWRVGVRDPRGASDDTFAVLELSDLSASTSGDYERYFELDGVRYHHVLDPRTGRPSHGVRSVTVVAADATLADALSTALMILPLERGLAVAESLPGVEAVLVDEDATARMTTGFTDLVASMRGPKP